MLPLPHPFILADALTIGAVIFYSLVFLIAMALAQSGRLLLGLVTAVVLFLSATLVLDLVQADVSLTGNRKVIVFASMWARGEAKQKIFDKVIEDFEKKYPQYHVKIQFDGRWVVSMNRPRLLTHKDVPDIIEGSNEELRILVQEQYAIPLDGSKATGIPDYMDASSPETGRAWREDWIPALYELGRYHLKPPTGKDGKPLIGKDGEPVPHPLENKLMLACGIYYDTVWFYNKAAARRLGLTRMPRTWSEFKAACQKAKDAGLEPIQLDEGYATEVANSLLQSSVPPGELRKTILGEAGFKPFTDPMYLRLFTLERELLDKYTMRGWEASQYPAAQQAFATGSGLFLLCGTWLPGELQEVAVTDKNVFEMGCFPFPRFEDEAPGTAVIGPSGWLVLKDGNEREGAIRLLQFMSNHHFGPPIAIDDGNPVAFAGDPIPPALQDIHEELSHMTRAVNAPIQAYAPKWQQYVYLQLHDDFMKAKADTLAASPADFVQKLEAATAEYRKKGEAKWD